ncbi:MAG: ribosome silencing factor [Gammaproteobacteria bacterium]|uniref:ribosome silencing factor n=1 Tax=Acidovorax sp. JG5 TaxID=2822718 RepID=UPI001B333F9E|nr:ribosome silencing factor [Acidovorax sp. JG5]MBP3981516.1 ribosome silencing factor [Acidovorax sp. JG5]MBU4423479.1 ribosome silencing factor [Gammaproteobacteria bacterium]
MTTSTKSETAAKKDVTKLQRAIVDGLEDVKAQDIQVFNTEHLSPLFERVIVASGTSNRQTKALAASVRDAVKDAGFVKPRIEGEENGEWIIVDCGAAVAHIMQPAIRQYYRLEELWGDTPVRLKLGAAKPVSSAATELAEKKSAQKAAKSGAKAAGKAPAKKAAAPVVAARSGKATVKAVAKTAAKAAATPAAKTTAKAPAKAITKAPAKAPAKRSSVAKAAPAKASAKPTTAAKKPAATKAAIKTVVVKPSAPRSKTAAAAKTGAKPIAARGGAVAKPAAKRAPGRK